MDFIYSKLNSAWLSILTPRINKLYLSATWLLHLHPLSPTCEPKFRTELRSYDKIGINAWRQELFVNIPIFCKDNVVEYIFLHILFLRNLLDPQCRGFLFPLSIATRGITEFHISRHQFNSGWGGVGAEHVFCPWTFSLNIGLNPGDWTCFFWTPFMSCLHSLVGYSTGEFQALQLIVLAAFGAVD